MNKLCGVYFDTWASKWVSKSSDMDLAKIPAPFNVVYLAFAQPDMTYKSGSYNLSGTGLNFSQDFSVVKGAIKILQAKGTKVMLSVGGASYLNWAGMNTKAIDALVLDLELDGVDIDFEPSYYGLAFIIYLINT